MQQQGVQQKAGERRNDQVGGGAPVSGRRGFPASALETNSQSFCKAGVRKENGISELNWGGRAFTTIAQITLGRMTQCLQPSSTCKPREVSGNLDGRKTVGEHNATLAAHPKWGPAQACSHNAPAHSRITKGGGDTTLIRFPQKRTGGDFFLQHWQISRNRRKTRSHPTPPRTGLLKQPIPLFYTHTNCLLIVVWGGGEREQAPINCHKPGTWEGGGQSQERTLVPAELTYTHTHTRAPSRGGGGIGECISEPKTDSVRSHTSEQ